MRARRGGGDRERDRGDGQRLVNGRPRKTQEELDREMEDYWGGQKKEEGLANGVVQNGNANSTANGFGGVVFDTATADAPPAQEAVVIDDGDIDMIE